MASWRRPAGASGTIQTWLDGRGAPIADFTPARPNLSETFSLPTYTGPATPTPISLFVLGRPEVSSNGTIRVPALSAEVGTVVFIAGVVRGAGPAVYGSGVLRSRRSAVTLIIKPAAKARKALAQYKHLRLQLGVEFLAAGSATPRSITQQLTVRSNAPAKRPGAIAGADSKRSIALLTFPTMSQPSYVVYVVRRQRVRLVNGHLFLPSGGHEIPHWWPSFLPTGGHRISPPRGRVQESDGRAQRPPCANPR